MTDHKAEVRLIWPMWIQDEAEDEQYDSLGYTIIPGLIPDSLFQPLQQAADRVTDRSRQGRWPQIRVVGKQFPPWNLRDDGKGLDDVWGVQNLMHPGLGEGVFTDWYGSGEMLEASASLMGCTVDEMQFGESEHRGTIKTPIINMTCCLFSSVSRRTLLTCSLQSSSTSLSILYTPHTL